MPPVKFGRKIKGFEIGTLQCKKQLSKFSRIHSLQFYLVNQYSEGVPHLIPARSFASLWPKRLKVQIWEDLMHTDRDSKAQGCAEVFWVHYATSKNLILHHKLKTT